jgi:hypothetical protein
LHLHFSPPVSRGGIGTRSHEHEGPEESNLDNTVPVKVKDPHTRIKPLAFASGHGRYNIYYIYIYISGLDSFWTPRNT